MKGGRIAALIPALDCAETLAHVVRGARKRLDHVLVVDDGSTDGTAGVAEAAGAFVLRHDANCGKGVAIRDGLVALRDRGFTHALTLDGDGQHLTSEIPKLLAEAEADPTAIVIGARKPDDRVAPEKRFGNELANLFVYLVTGEDFLDTQSGFRVYPIEPTLALGTTGSRFELETEVLIRAARAGIPVRVVRTKTHYPPPEERKSHYDATWDTVRIIRTVFGLWARVL